MSGAFGNLFGSKATPVQTSQTPTGFNSLPQFGQDAFKTAVAGATNAYNNPSIFSPTAFNADQNQSFDLARQGYTNVTPESFNSALSMFQNPYEDQVVSKALSDLRMTGQGALNDLGAGATAAGGFGSTRQAVNESELIKNLAAEGGALSGALRSGNYQSAAQNAINSIGTNNANQQQQMSDLSNTGALQQAQATQVQQSPLEAIQFLLSAAQGLPTGGGSTGSTLRENTGALQKIGSASQGMGSLAALFSDARLKHSISKDGLSNGHQMYRFSYLGDSKVYRGVMAQDVIKTHPQSVIMRDGYMMVDYGKLGVNMERIS